MQQHDEPVSDQGDEHESAELEVTQTDPSQTDGDLQSDSSCESGASTDHVDHDEEDVVAVIPSPRRGNVEKCPVCGSGVDAEAFYCPTCHNYFCFHCRARQLPNDTQLQCVNRHCEYYGKLICCVCDPTHDKEELPTVYSEPEDGYWPGWLVIALLAGAVIWYQFSFLLAAAVSTATFLLGGLAMHSLGLNIFGRDREVQHQRKTSFHSCLKCGHTVKQLPGK